MKLPSPPVLAGIAFAVVIVVIIIVAAVTKKKDSGGSEKKCTSDSDCTPPQTCNADGNCAAPTSYTYKREDNSVPNSYWGCQYPGAGLPSSLSDRSAVADMCTSKPDCIGFYDNELGPYNPWSIATNVEPAACTQPSEKKQVYPAFYRKVAS